MAQSQAKLIEAVSAMASDGRDGVLLVLEAESTTLNRLRAQGASDEQVAAILREAFELAAKTLEYVEGARTGWGRFEFALLGARQALTVSAMTLAAALLSHPTCRSLA